MKVNWHMEIIETEELNKNGKWILYYNESLLYTLIYFMRRKSKELQTDGISGYTSDQSTTYDAESESSYTVAYTTTVSVNTVSKIV